MLALFYWLNKNAAAVQALAAIASALATIALLLITRQYVLLTQELARAAREQLQRTIESESAQLITLIDVFLGSLKRFPSGREAAAEIKNISLWKHADVSTFGTLASTVLGSRPEVQRAIQRLNWLHATAEHAQEAARDDGSAPDDLPWADWQRQIEEARAALQTVRSVASAGPP